MSTLGLNAVLTRVRVAKSPLAASCRRSSLEEHGREDCDVAGRCNRRATGRFNAVAAEIMRLLASAVTAYNQHKARRL
jgi:hypothetical protein